MGTPIKVLVKDQPVFVCCNACAKSAVTAADATLKKVADLRAGKKSEGERRTGRDGETNLTATKPTPKSEKIVKALAKLSPADRVMAEKQEFCVVRPKSELGSMETPHKILIKGQPAFLCCAGCEQDALKNPQATLAMVTKLQQAAQKKSSQ